MLLISSGDSIGQSSDDALSGGYSSTYHEHSFGIKSLYPDPNLDCMPDYYLLREPDSEFQNREKHRY
jgi:hypothetical protein